MVAIAFAVAILVIGLAVYSSTAERSREYATLKALGLDRRSALRPRRRPGRRTGNRRNRARHRARASARRAWHLGARAQVPDRGRRRERGGDCRQRARDGDPRRARARPLPRPARPGLGLPTMSVPLVRRQLLASARAGRSPASPGSRVALLLILALKAIFAGISRPADGIHRPQRRRRDRRPARGSTRCT